MFCVNPMMSGLERLPVMIVIQTDGVLGSVVTGGQARWVSTVSPGVASVPSVATTVGQEGHEGCWWRGLAWVMVGHLVGVAVIVAGVVRVEMRPLGGSGGRGQGLLTLSTVHLTGASRRWSRRSHQVVSDLPRLLHTGALLLLPPHHADDDADQEEDRHYGETHHQDHHER